MDNFTVKVGAVQIDDAVINIGNHGKVDGKCRLNGVMGNVFNIVLEKLNEQGIRCILTGNDELGSFDQISEQYSGALGELQSGKTHFVVMPAYYPLNDPNETMIHSAILYEDTMTIFSGYNISRKEHRGNLFDMFTMVPTGLWIGYFVSFFVFATVTYFGAYLLKQKYSSLWMTICAFLDQDNFPTDSTFVQVLSFVVMLGMFYMMTYAGNCMGTDLVSIEDPITITTYEEIMDKRVETALAKVLPEYDRFQEAPKNSFERKMFENRYELEFNSIAVAKLTPAILDQKVVLIARRIAVETSAILFASLDSFPDDGRAYVAPDKHAQKYTNVFAISSRIKGSKAERRLSQVLARMGEHGFAHYVCERLSVPVAQAVIPGSGLPSSQRKISSSVEQLSADVADISFEHTYPVMIALLAAVIGSGAVLFIEFYHHWVIRRIMH